MGFGLLCKAGQRGGTPCFQPGPTSQPKATRTPPQTMYVRMRMCGQVRRPLYRTARGRWARYASQLEPLRTALGGTVTRYEARLAAVLVAHNGDDDVDLGSWCGAGDKCEGEVGGRGGKGAESSGSGGLEAGAGTGGGAGERERGDGMGVEADPALSQVAAELQGLSGLGALGAGASGAQARLDHLPHLEADRNKKEEL